MNLNIFLLNSIFYVLAFGIITFATLMISAKETIHAAFYMISTFFHGTGLILLLGAEFISFTILIVYIGAVAVLILFIIMMINFNQEKQSWKKPLIYCGLTFLTEFVLFLILKWWNPFYGALYKAPLNKNLLQYVFDPHYINFTIQDIGSVLYTEYFIAFQLTGLILLTVTIGAILICVRHRKQYKKQNIYEQLDRSVENSLQLKDVTKSGLGHDDYL